MLICSQYMCRSPELEIDVGLPINFRQIDQQVVSDFDANVLSKFQNFFDWVKEETIKAENITRNNSVQKQQPVRDVDCPDLAGHAELFPRIHSMNLRRIVIKKESPPDTQQTAASEEAGLDTPQTVANQKDHMDTLQTEKASKHSIGETADGDETIHSQRVDSYAKFLTNDETDKRDEGEENAAIYPGNECAKDQVSESNCVSREQNSVNGACASRGANEFYLSNETAGEGHAQEETSDWKSGQRSFFDDYFPVSGRS
ncbi:unnamed protein product [Gongylonema pulchrum]|uniref:EB1 C-terminal domain-containing protein n=1 Tax=Gongylonema pulchrum TaxID=637853 RepID=A0A183EQC8_9BILA|nr:unnamed protein product [Gongylonema pulchrum]